MKWDAASIRRSAASQSSRAVARSPASARDAGQRVEGEDLDVGVASCGARRRGSRRGVGRRRRRRPRRPSRRAGTRRGRPALRRRRSRCHALAASSASRAAPCSPERAQDAPEVHPAERGQAHVAGGLGLLDRELERGGAGLVVAGLALRPPEARRAGTPRSGGSRDGATSPRHDRCARRRRRTGAGCGPARRASRRGERGATGRRRVAASAGPDRAPRRCDPRRRRRSRPARRRASSRPGPTAGRARRRARGCGRSAPARRCKSPSMRHDVGEVVGSSGPAGRRRRSRRRARRLSSMWSRASSRSTGRRFDPRREQERVGSVRGTGPRRRPHRARRGSAGRPGCRRGRPTPTRTR